MTNMSNWNWMAIVAVGAFAVGCGSDDEGSSSSSSSTSSGGSGGNTSNNTANNTTNNTASATSNNTTTSSTTGSGGTGSDTTSDSTSTSAGGATGGSAGETSSGGAAGGAGEGGAAGGGGDVVTDTCDAVCAHRALKACDGFTTEGCMAECSGLGTFLVDSGCETEWVAANDCELALAMDDYTCPGPMAASCADEQAAAFCF